MNQANSKGGHLWTPEQLQKHKEQLAAAGGGQDGLAGLNSMPGQA